MVHMSYEKKPIFIVTLTLLIKIDKNDKYFFLMFY